MIGDGSVCSRPTTSNGSLQAWPRSVNGTMVVVVGSLFQSSVLCTGDAEGPLYLPWVGGRIWERGTPPRPRMPFLDTLRLRF
jgi:hypothetical protein